MVASMLDALARVRARRHQLKMLDPLRPRTPKRPDQRFIAGEDLTRQQTAEIEALNRANVAPAASGPDLQRCPFPSVPLQPGADGVPWR
jgi:hypothetical protein